MIQPAHGQRTFQRRATLSTAGCWKGSGSAAGRQSCRLTFEYRHIYVMPTRFGFWFGFLLALTALGGLNFNNNMTLMLGFLLAAIAQLTTCWPTGTWSGFEWKPSGQQPVFAGEAAFPVLVRNPEQRNRFAIEAVSPEARDCKDIRPRNGSTALKQLTLSAGLDEMEPFRIENRYPLGLFQGLGSHHTAGAMPGVPKARDQPAALAQNGPWGVRGGAHGGR